MYKRYYRLEPGDANALRELIQARGLKQVSLAEHLNLHYSEVSKLFRGSMGISPKLAQKIYEFFDNDKKIQFLERYIGQEVINTRKPKYENYVEYGWVKLYAHYTLVLGEVYRAAEIKEKTHILQSLEKIIKQYKPKQESEQK